RWAEFCPTGRVPWCRFPDEEFADVLPGLINVIAIGQNRARKVKGGEDIFGLRRLRAPGKKCQRQQCGGHLFDRRSSRVGTGHRRHQPPVCAGPPVKSTEKRSRKAAALSLELGRRAGLSLGRSYDSAHLGNNSPRTPTGGAVPCPGVLRLSLTPGIAASGPSPTRAACRRRVTGGWAVREPDWVWRHSRGGFQTHRCTRRRSGRGR